MPCWPRSSRGDIVTFWNLNFAISEGRWRSWKQAFSETVHLYNPRNGIPTPLNQSLHKILMQAGDAEFRLSSSLEGPALRLKMMTNISDSTLLPNNRCKLCKHVFTIVRRIRSTSILLLVVAIVICLTKRKFLYDHPTFHPNLLQNYRTKMFLKPPSSY